MALNAEKKEEQSQQLERRHYFAILENERARIDKKNQFRNLTRYMSIQRQEMEENDLIQKTKEEAACKERQMERENNLAREMVTVKRDEMKEKLYRQQLRENSHELRDLERQLKAAYMNKALSAQMAQKEAEKLNEKIQDKKIHEILTKSLVTEAEYRKKMAQEEIYKKAIYKQELQDQIILRDKSNRFLYEEFLIEKKMIDDIIERIHDEDHREMQEKMCRMKKTREEMMAFKQAQELWKKKKMDEIEEENRKIQEYLMSKVADIKAKQEEKERQEAVKALISENIAKRIFAEKAKQKEREDIIQDLLEEEQKEAVEKRHRAEVEKQIRQKIEVRESLTAQMADRKMRERQIAEEDAKYKEELLIKLAEDERVEQMSAQKKRMKMLQLRRDVEQSMIDRRQKHAEEMQLMIKLEEQEEAEMKQRQEIIEEERRKMLNDHIKNLIGYLPKGLLKPEDLPYLESGVVDHLSRPKK